MNKVNNWNVHLKSHWSDIGLQYSNISKRKTKLKAFLIAKLLMSEDKLIESWEFICLVPMLTLLLCIVAFISRINVYLLIYYFTHVYFSLIYAIRISSVCITERHNPIIGFMMKPNFYSRLYLIVNWPNSNPTYCNVSVL